MSSIIFCKPQGHFLHTYKVLPCLLAHRAVMASQCFGMREQCERKAGTLCVCVEERAGPSCRNRPLRFMALESSDPRATQPSGCCLSSRLSFHLCKLVVEVAQLTGCRGDEPPSAWRVPRRPSGSGSCLIVTLVLIPFTLGTSSVHLLSGPHVVGTE